MKKLLSIFTILSCAIVGMEKNNNDELQKPVKKIFIVKNNKTKTQLAHVCKENRQLEELLVNQKSLLENSKKTIERQNIAIDELKWKNKKIRTDNILLTNKVMQQEEVLTWLLKEKLPGSMLVFDEHGCYITKSHNSEDEEKK